MQTFVTFNISPKTLQKYFKIGEKKYQYSRKVKITKKKTNSFSWLLQ